MAACEVAPVFVGRRFPPRPSDPSLDFSSSTWHAVPRGAGPHYLFSITLPFLLPEFSSSLSPPLSSTLLASHTDPYALVWGRVLSISLPASYFTLPLKK